MKLRLILIIIIAVSAGLFVLSKSNSISVSTVSEPEATGLAAIKEFFSLKEEAPAEVEASSGSKLQNPPPKLNVLYATSWSASSKDKMDYFIDLAKNTEANALIVDIKDYSGLLAYKTENPDLIKYASVEEKIKDPIGLVRELHENHIYTIARIVVFQDPALTVKRPDLAIMNAKTGKIWMDQKKLSWVDPASKEVWNYNVALAKDAFAKGFDEVNFDYVRFPSDGDLTIMSYPAYNEKAKTKSETIKEFFTYLRTSLKNEKISVDLFGLTVIAKDDLGIGQIIEDSFSAFDFVCPMVYPSHFSTGIFGYDNPVDHPYEVIKQSMEEATKKLERWKTAYPNRPAAKIRPWLQDFDLGKDYGVSEVKGQIKAVAETTDAGWMMWNPQNIYTLKAISNKP